MPEAVAVVDSPWSWFCHRLAMAYGSMEMEIMMLLSISLSLFLMGRVHKEYANDFLVL